LMERNEKKARDLRTRKKEADGKGSLRKKMMIETDPEFCVFKYLQPEKAQERTIRSKRKSTSDLRMLPGCQKTRADAGIRAFFLTIPWWGKKGTSWGKKREERARDQAMYFFSNYLEKGNPMVRNRNFNALWRREKKGSREGSREGKEYRLGGVAGSGAIFEFGPSPRKQPEYERDEGAHFEREGKNQTGSCLHG